MDDIAPELLNKTRKSFLDNIKNDDTASSILKKIKDGSATYTDASKYADKVGNALVDAINGNISSDVLPDGKMYWNISDRVIRPLLELDHGNVADATALVQQSINDSVGIGLKAQSAELNQDRVSGILNKLTLDTYDNVKWMIGEPIINFSMSIVDDTVRANYEFLGRAGIESKIIRTTAAKCCKWCHDLAGTYTYPNTPKDVFRRHDYCRCRVDYIAPDKSKTVHTGTEGKRRYIKNSTKVNAIAKKSRVENLNKMKKENDLKMLEEKEKRLNELANVEEVD